MTTSTREFRAQEEAAILEEILLEHLVSHAHGNVVFLAFENSDFKYIDPPEAVLNRIRSAGIPARKVSEATKDKQTRVIDMASGQLGSIYYARVIRWHGDSKIDVIVGRHSASLAGDFTESTMEKKDQKWTRTKIKRTVLAAAWSSTSIAVPGTGTDFGVKDRVVEYRARDGKLLEKAVWRGGKLLSAWEFLPNELLPEDVIEAVNRGERNWPPPKWTQTVVNGNGVSHDWDLDGREIGWTEFLNGEGGRGGH
jgi:hypothetical protein